MELSATPILDASSVYVILCSFIKSCSRSCGVSLGRYCCAINKSSRFFFVFSSLDAGIAGLLGILRDNPAAPRPLCAGDAALIA